jgi:GT2 family glycosyltransferase
MPKVYVVIVNFRQFDHTIECLESLLKSSYKNFQIVLVDNSEDEVSIQKIMEWSIGSYCITKTNLPELVYPLTEAKQKEIKFIHEVDLETSCVGFDEKILLVKTITNKGFAAANNIALRYLLRVNDLDFVWLLNNDTVVEKKSLDDLVQFTRVQNLDVGIIGTKLLYYHNPQIIQAVGGVYNKWLATTMEIGNGEIDVGQYDKGNNIRFNYVVGASMFISKIFLQKVGLMDESYFLYYEEYDWAKRGQSLSFKLGLCPGVKIYHKQGSSISPRKDGMSRLADYYSIRNRFHVTRKFFPELLPVIYLTIFPILINRIKRKEFSRIGLIVRAILNIRS